MNDLTSIKFGTPGHEAEYTIHVKGYGHDNYIPRKVETLLQNALPDWVVESRGSRIEIMGRRSTGRYGDRDDTEVVLALRETLSRYEQHVQEIWNEQLDIAALRIQPSMAQALLEQCLDLLAHASRGLAGGPAPWLLRMVEELETKVDLRQDLCDECLSASIVRLAQAVRIPALRTWLSSSAGLLHAEERDRQLQRRLAAVLQPAGEDR